jgi:hypothetical protein
MTTHSLITLNSTTAIRLSPVGTHSGCDVTIQNVDSTQYVYVGGASVSTTSYGYRISPNHAISFELPGKDALYAVASDDGVQTAVIITGLEAGS